MLCVLPYTCSCNYGTSFIHIHIALKLNQYHLFTYPPVCESMLELIFILKCVIIILHFMIIGLFVIKNIHSINDKISE